MANLIKKVVVLIVILLIVVAAYMIKNQDVREEVLIKLGVATSKDFKIPEDIKISMDEINMEGLDNNSKVVLEEPEENEQPVETPKNEPEITLEDIEAQVEQIALQVDLIQKQVDILIAMNEIEQQINDLAGQQGNVLSSI